MDEGLDASSIRSTDSDDAGGNDNGSSNEMD
jgi:hypothetical protein